MERFTLLMYQVLLMNKASGVYTTQNGRMEKKHKTNIHMLGITSNGVMSKIVYKGYVEGTLDLQGLR